MQVSIVTHHLNFCLIDIIFGVQEGSSVEVHSELRTRNLGGKISENFFFNWGTTQEPYFIFHALHTGLMKWLPQVFAVSRAILYTSSLTAVRQTLLRFTAYH